MRLYERGYDRQDVVNLFRFIDWVLQLPERLEEEFWHEVQQFEEEKRMPYVTSIERMGMKKGLREGMQQGLLAGIELGLELKFGSEGLCLLPEVHGIGDLAVLRAIHEGLKTANTLEELRRGYQ